MAPSTSIVLGFMQASSRDEIARKAIRIMFRIQVTKLSGNIIGGVSLIASIVTPFSLLYFSGNITNLLLLIVYPLTVAICATVRYNGILGEGILFLPIAFAIISSKYLSQATYFCYFAIILGIVAQYYIQFYKLPPLEKELQCYSNGFSSSQQD